MKKFLCGIFVILALAGCYWTEMECFPSDKFIRINFMSRDNFDSISFYLENRKVCTKGIGEAYRNIICRISSENNYFSDMPFSNDSLSKCVLSEEFPLWHHFECTLKKEEGWNNSINTTVYIFRNNKIDSLSIPVQLAGGNHFNLISEQDTARWYRYTEMTLKAYFDYFGPGESWERLGCFNGYCVASLPIVEEEYCFDK